MIWLMFALHVFIITDSLYKIQQFDWLILKQSDILCLHQIALCNATRVHSSGAPRWQPSWTISNKCNLYRTKIVYFFYPAVEPLTSRTSSPASDFKSYAWTSALKPANLQQVSVKARIFSQGPFIVTGKIHWKSLNNNLWWKLNWFNENYSMENQYATTKRVRFCMWWKWQGSRRHWSL